MDYKYSEDDPHLKRAFNEDEDPPREPDSRGGSGALRSGGALGPVEDPPTEPPRRLSGSIGRPAVGRDSDIDEDPPKESEIEE